MAKKKLERIAEVKTFPNVSHAGAELKGQWHTIFKNGRPMTLELGCGKGDYTLALAQQHPERNYIGIDLKSARLWAAATQAMQKSLSNVFFIRANALDLTDIFAPDDIAEIWIPFPDPYPQKPRKRMTAARYLEVYKKICRPDARINVKTDDEALYEFSLATIADYGCTIHQKIAAVHADDATEELGIMTFYEKRHLAAGRSIKYIQFSLP
ncbi:tRNA (guanosine(46)-N7)-methyltransferase TrmB [candidate division KSB1 bacterium]|nr:tRNA (guanosine(46)-N7)-methyltransferase TrmB [candidate division KSB1 bacterium]RQW08056.1 MAG: tRNA (guanosine(46)-N7)-methyltransferase TrmB [candidate division KSB1 bacterium]